MNLKIISYDLRKPDQNYDELIQEIKTYNYCQINKSDWLISTFNSCKSIRNHLIKCIDENDTLFV